MGVVSRRGLLRMLLGGAAAGLTVTPVRAGDSASSACGLDKETVEQALTLLAVVGNVSLNGLANHNKRIMRLERLVWEPGRIRDGRGKI